MALPEFKTPRRYNWQLAHDRISRDNTAFYFHNCNLGTVIEVNTLKGIIELNKFDVFMTNPKPAFGSPVQLYINNPALDLTEANRDNVYVQITPYYKRSVDDNALPYVVPNGFIINGLGVEVYNASPQPAGTKQWEGALYIYYEIYTIN